MIILAVDWGERRIGLAISDPLGVLARGLATLRVLSERQAVEGIAAVAAENEVERIVVGMPLLMSGERGRAAVAAQSLADALAARTQLPVETWDERLTSALGSRRLREAGVRTGHAKERIDAEAAIALLESWLQRHAGRGAG